MQTTSPVDKKEVAVRFIDMDNVSHEGIFIPNENMFFIGFGESGKFKYTFEVKFWEYLSDDYIKTNGIDKQINLYG